jgi:hypothetical protein
MTSRQRLQNQQKTAVFSHRGRPPETKEIANRSDTKSDRIKMKRERTYVD